MTILQGSKGSGKSATAVAMAINHLYKGGVVAANFRLKDGWAEEMSSRHILSKFSKRIKQELAVSLWSRFFLVRSVEAIQSIDVFSLATGRKRSRPGKYQEGQGILLLDECQLMLNSRKSMQGDKNMRWVEFFTQARKRGWVEILIAHKAEMIDSQIRDLAEYESRFRNLQKVRIPVLGLPLSPIPFFLGINRYAGYGPGAGVIHSRDWLPLPIWAARLYDTKLIFSQDDYNGAASIPEHCGPMPQPWRGKPDPPRVSRLVGPHWDSYLQTIPGEGYSERNAPEGSGGQALQGFAG